MLTYNSKLFRVPIIVRRSASCWAGVVRGPPDPVFGVAEAFKKDSNPKRVNLSVGAYRSDEGKPWVLGSVRNAEKLVCDAKMNKEYAPMLGIDQFRDLAAKLAFGEDSEVIKEKRNATLQSLSGTGALRIGGELIKQFYPGKKVIYLPDPTWPNHPNIFKSVDLEVRKYRYYYPKTRGLDTSGLLDDIEKMEPGSVILLHACAHNPTGVDPNKSEWKAIAEKIKGRKLLPFFDMAYQGFASGSLAFDAYSVRHFVNDQNIQILLAQSFAKNMGLYGERVGAFTAVCSSSEEATNVLSHLKRVVRSIYSNPPLHGARIAQTILSDPKLTEQWYGEMKTMSGRIIKMRELLLKNLKDAGSTLSWKHVVDQIGMFCYTGLTPEQVERITKEYSIYMTKDGRISIAGLNAGNNAYVARAIHEVTK
ncbi:hypothetical protein ACOME3_000162 [Neoechinorhynchus agilis]